MEPTAHHNVLPALQDRLVPIEDTHPFPGNPRKGDIAAVADSLTVSGQYRPLVRQASTGYVLKGNGTREAALTLGWTHIAVEDVDVDDLQAAQIVAADNATSDAASYDEERLADMLQAAQEATGLLGTAFTDGDTADLLASLGRDDEESYDDADDGSTAAGAFREVMLVYASEVEREEFLSLIDTLAAKWGVEVHASHIVLRSLELARV